MIELPKDYEGREIPLDTEVLYDNNGMKFNVDEFKLCALPSLRTSFWTTRGVFEDEEEKCNFLPHLLHLVQPDSWKRILDDLDKAASKMYCGTCTYFGKNPTDCDTDYCHDVTCCFSDDSIFVIITCGIVALCLFIALMCCAADLVTHIASPEAAMLNNMLQAVQK